MKTKIFFIALISFFTLCINIQAKTTHIKMNQDITLHYLWASGDTFVVHKPWYLGPVIWRTNGATLGIGDSLIFVPTTSGQHNITAAWNGHHYGLVLNLYKTIEKSLCECLSTNSINLDSIAKGAWTGNGVFGDKFLPPVVGPGTYQLYCYDIMSDNKPVVIYRLTLVVNTNPIVHFASIPTVDQTQEAFPLVYGIPQGGVYEGRGITRMSNDDYFNAKEVGIGRNTILYTYTHPVTGCSSTASEIITVK
jgi:hypothetical protein